MTEQKVKSDSFKLHEMMSGRDLLKSEWRFLNRAWKLVKSDIVVKAIGEKITELEDQINELNIEINTLYKSIK